MKYPPKPAPGARVAVVSPSAGLPAVFPEVYELGLRRMRDEYGLEPVEYPTTRVLGAPAADRARDLQAAFADPSIEAVFASIGGDDQLTILRHLDDAVFLANPKPFFGYSDNITLLNYLYGLGIVGYHGGSVMVHLGRGGEMHPVTAASLRTALFDTGWAPLTAASHYTDEPGDWNDPGFGGTPPTMFPSAGWRWHGPERVVEGRVWGGNIEVLTWLLASGRVGPVEAYAGSVLLTETSEDMPSAVDVYYMLRNLGERGLLETFPAILVGRAKAWERDRQLAPDAKRAFADDQRAAVLRAVGEYAPDAVVVFDLDVGHTDPQEIVPYGGDVRVDAIRKTVEVRY